MFVRRHPVRISVEVALNFDNPLATFPDDAVDISTSGGFTVPKEFISLPRMIIVWASKANTGGVVWKFGYNSVGVLGNLDPTIREEVVTVRTNAGSIEKTKIETIITLSENLSPDDNVLYGLTRVNTDKVTDGLGDDMMGDSGVFDILFEFNGV